MMEAASTSEKSGNLYQTTWRYNSEDSHLLIEGILMTFILGDYTKACQADLMLVHISPV
jgi:hypothetical protein